MDPVRAASAIAGLILILTTFYWAARILMVKGTDPPTMARFVFRASRNALHFAGERMPSDSKRRELWALYIPVSLISILGVSLMVATVGYTFLLYGVTQNSMRTAYVNSVSSMSVLGIAGEPKTLIETTIGGFEAFTGPIFVALLIAYTVTIYSAYSDHSAHVEELDAAISGSESGSALLVSAAQNGGLATLSPIWETWTDEFAQLERTYRSVDGYLLLFAPNMSKHWSADAPMVLDSAALRNTLVAGPPDQTATDCLAAGTQSLQDLADHYDHRVLILRKRAERPEIDRTAFDRCADQLATAGIDLVSDRERAWHAFQTTRARYKNQAMRLARILPYNEKS